MRIYKNMSRTTTKVRLVRCPKCRLILPEMPNIPVYQCGGCFTTLQAKSQRQTITSLPETRLEVANDSDNVSEDKASSSTSRETTLQCAKDCHSDQNTRMGQTESEIFNNINNLKCKNIEDESENERNMSDQNGEKLACTQSNGVLEIGSSNNETDDDPIICATSSNENHNNDSHQHDSSISNENCLPEEPVINENGELLQVMSATTRFNVEDNGDSSSFIAETDVNSETGSTYKRWKKGEIVDTAGESSSSDVGDELHEQPHEPASHGLDRLRSTDTFYSTSSEQLQETAVHALDRLMSADTFYASPNEQLEQIQGRTIRGLDRLRSTDTLYVSSNEQLEQPPENERPTYEFDPTSFVNPSSELSISLIDLSKSPTTRSSRAYYDDGVSSYEGLDDQLPNRLKHGSKHAHRAASDTRPSRRERVPVSSNYRNCAAIPLNYKKFDRDELLESTRLGHSGRNWMNFKRDEYLHHHSFYKRESRAAPNRIPNEFYNTSNFSSPDRGAYGDQEKAKLLRMVSVLQDQLKKASLNGRVSWKDHQIPMYYDLEEGSFYNSVDPAYSGSNWSPQGKYSQIPFSAESAIGRHHTDYSLCSCPQERKWSAQLPPSRLGFNKGLCKAYSRPNLCYGSCPSSPQRHVDPRFHMYSRRAKSDDQMHRDDGNRKYLREKPHLPKRHLRPLAGGAPFVTCPYCLKQLQLPADFLLFKKRCHRLKCGACSEVLKFSLVNYTRLFPYTPVAEAPPPSEADEHSNRRRNFTSTSHVTDCPSVSCSDDCKRCSRGNAFDRKVSDGMLENGKKRKTSYLNETGSKGKAPMEYESAGPSTSTSHSKIISSEIEELPEEAERGGNSPLHRLMGYSSVRQIMYG